MRIRLSWFCLGGLAAFLTVVLIYPPIRQVAIPYYPCLQTVVRAATGRSTFCRFSNALAATFQNRNKLRLEKSMRQSCRLIQVDPDGNSLFDSPKGRFWLPKGAGAEFLAILVAEQTLDVYTFQDQGVRAGDIVLDCGANIGIFTREALNKGAKLVVAIEPSPENLVCLRRNLAREIAESRVVVYEKGVWDRDDKLFLETRDESNPGADQIRADGSGRVGTWVPLTTIDKLVAELQLAQVSFIKMDIEGAEQRAMTGAANTLAQHKPRLAIATEHGDRLENTRNVLTIVKRLGPSYKWDCGLCTTEVYPQVIPEILYFHL